MTTNPSGIYRLFKQVSKNSYEAIELAVPNWFYSSQGAEKALATHVPDYQQSFYAISLVEASEIAYA